MKHGALGHILAGLMCLVALWACARHEPAPAPDAAPSTAAPAATPTHQPGTSAEADDLLAAKDRRILQMERELQAERADRKVIAAERDRLAEDEAIKSTRRFTLWVSWLAGFGFFASVVAYFLLSGYAPWIGKLCIGGAAAALAVLALARVVSWLAPYLFAVGCALTACGVVVLVLFLRRSTKVTESVVKLYEDAKPELDKTIGKVARVKKQVETVGKHSTWIEALRRKAGIA